MNTAISLTKDVGTFRNSCELKNYNVTHYPILIVIICSNEITKMKMHFFITKRMKTFLEHIFQKSYSPSIIKKNVYTKTKIVKYYTELLFLNSFPKYHSLQLYVKTLHGPSVQYSISSNQKPISIQYSISQLCCHVHDSIAKNCALLCSDMNFSQKRNRGFATNSNA